jgi:SAM-dependent methyltransferase
VSFEVDADAYDRFMGRYSRLLAPQLAELAGVRNGGRGGQHVLDVGCGPGALTAELVARLGPGAVSAVDPSASFVAATRRRHPGVGVTVASAQALPFEDATFDVTLAQLVLPFIPDPAAGLREMRRVTREGGTVAACVWDHAGGRTPMAVFWAAARDLDPGAYDEAGQIGATEGQLEELLAAAGLRDVVGSTLHARVAHRSFEAWWETFTLGIGPPGAYVAGLDPDARDALRERCRQRLGDAPPTIGAWAWAARGER